MNLARRKYVCLTNRSEPREERISRRVCFMTLFGTLLKLKIFFTKIICRTYTSRALYQCILFDLNIIAFGFCPEINSHKNVLSEQVYLASDTKYLWWIVDNFLYFIWSFDIRDSWHDLSVRNVDCICINKIKLLSIKRKK